MIKKIYEGSANILRCFIYKITKYLILFERTNTALMLIFFFWKINVDILKLIIILKLATGDLQIFNEIWHIKEKN